MAAAASDAIGGTFGAHARPHRWLSPVAVVLLVTAAMFTLGLATKNACAQGDWWEQSRQFANLCYSDLPHAYADRGGAERVPPLSDDEGRYPQPTQTPPTAVLSYAGTLVAQGLTGWPDTSALNDRPVAKVATDPQVQHEAVVYVGVVAVMLLLAALVSALALTRAQPNRPWDAALFAGAPVLALTATIGWDLVGVGCVAVALWAWSARWPRRAGAAIGVGAAFSVYPGLLVVATTALAMRAGRGRDAWQCLGSALLSWLALAWVLPGVLLAPGSELALADQYASAAASGSLWQVVGAFGLHLDTTLTNQLAFVSGAALVIGLVWFATTAGRPPRLPQLGLLLVVAVVLVDKQYAPQHALWLLGFAALARPYWRDLLIWQAGEIIFFLASWWHLGGYTNGGSNGVDEVYIGAICVRIAAQLWLAGTVVRDIRQPWLDPARPRPARPSVSLGPTIREFGPHHP